MKLRVRLLSALLAASLLGSLSAPALAASPPEPLTGSITATLRIDYAQNLSTLQDRNVQVELLRNGQSLGALPLAEAASSTSLGGYPAAAVSARNADGGDLGGGQWPGWLELTVKDLPQGSYALRFTGRGYTSYTQDVPLTDCNRHLILGTGDATFTLGDVNGDNRVDEKDRAALSRALGSTRQENLKDYDLNGDGTINIIDLAYINRQLEAQGSAECLETALLDPPVDTSAALAALTENGVSCRGELDSLFQPGGTGVTLEAEGDIQLVLPLSKEIEVSQIQITAPDGSGSPLKGVVVVEDEKGNQTAVPFDHTVPEDAHATGATPGKNVITVKLGNRVPVKKITITVTQTEGGEFAVLETIEFLKDIVPENPVAPYSKVSNIRTEPGNESVSLRWDELPNVSGYKVRYWLQGSSNTAQELRVDVPRATVTGLENLKTYVFTVTPIDGSWEGSPSDEVMAAPQPSGPPDRVDMVSVAPLDGQLAVSWKEAKSAVYYKVFYQEKGASQWQQAGGNLVQTSVTISGLTNGVTYSLYVTAWNDNGEGPKSALAEGTPKETDYSQPEGIPVDSLLDRSLIQSVKLADPNNYLASAYPDGFRPENVIDGNYRTHWTSSNNWSGNEHVEVTFTTPVDLSAVIWVPRLDGRYPTFLRAYSVQVWYQGEDLNGKGHLLVPDPARGGQDNGGGGADVHTWPTIPNQRTIPSDRFAIMPFDPAKGVVKISVAAEQVGYGGHNVSLSELMFVKYDPTKNLVDKIGALFEGGKDGLHTALVSGVTEEQITALENQLQAEKNYYFNTDVLADELALARELLKGAGSGAILHGIESRSGAADSKYSQGGSVLQPLGVTAQAGKDITIYVTGIPAGEKVTVYATQYNSEVSGWQASMGELHNGRNILRVPTLESRANMSKGGSLYLTYSGANPEGISIHVRRGTDIPVLELANWYSLDDTQRRTAIGAYVDELDAYLARTNISSPQTDYRNVTEISTPVVLLSLPAAAVQSALGQSSRDGKITTLYQTILAWEDVMHICKTTQGIDNTYEKNDMQTRQNIRCMTMFSGAFMYAAGNHIGIGYGSCGGMVTGRPVDKANPTWPNGLFGWGIAHEIGHNMDKLGKAEVTNNIYSLMVQTYDGTNNTGTSRLEASNKYETIFNKTAQGDPGASGNVFVQLGLYWQLHLAYDGGTNDEEGHGPMWFYNQFFKDWKAGTYTSGASSYDDKVALTASGVVGKNLTEFFTRWGMTLSESTKNTLKGYGAEDRAIWYLNDQSRRDRLSSAAAGAGTVTASAQKSGNTNVELTFGTALTAGKVQGYEILRNGQSIAFVIAGENGGGTYTDIIGSGNHRTYSYEVAAYDTLGNKIGSCNAGTIRIAYDKLVDESLYTVGERAADGTVVITMKEKTPVTGLKLTGGTVLTGGSFGVTIQVNGKSIPARSGSWDAAHNLAVDDPGSFVTYFQKPGAEAADTRIWTYSPETITVSNVPEGAKLALISFAGDDVAFLDSEQGAVGRLAKDYTYAVDEAGGTETIPAGTLVILGTYRGDPVYNTVKIKGIFQTSSINEAGEAVETDSVERYLDGYALLFAEVPKDGAVSDISDGIFIFVPNVQKEAELQGKEGEQNCDAKNLLPSRIQAVLSRTDLPDSADSQRISAESAWISSPGGTDLPIVVLE